MATQQRKTQWSPVNPEACTCDRCKACERRRRRESITRAQEQLFLGCDSACPDRANELVLLTAA
jgi:hypothetical protein